MSMRLRFFAIFAVAIGLATAAALASTSVILAKRLPERAIDLPIVDGNAYVNGVFNDVASPDQSGKRSSPAVLRNAAVRTFLREPTNSNAISLLAFTSNLNGDKTASRDLFGHALEQSQRNLLANLSLIEDASQNGRIGFILERYDALLRTGGVASETLLDVMTTAMREEAILPHMRSMLEARPPWAEQFWLRVARSRPALANAARLRLDLLKDGYGNPAGNDAELVRRLADDQQYSLAYQLFRKLAPGGQTAGNALRNADFSATPAFVPFDWNTFSDVRYDAEVDPAIKALVTSTESSRETLVGRQLVRLNPGRYAIGMKVRDPRILKDYATQLKMRCAGDGGEATLGTAKTPTIGSSNFVVSADCPFVWVEVWLRHSGPAGTTPTDDLEIARIDLALASGSASAAKSTMPQ
ncbi:hypothetical protein [Tsuneonella troitsensis]|uniref:hypothetical protein n=1 Tax=Tsuneonella troitsensis TaxID=292222 RepID=UPI000708A403|nr:hypothetical protein [Tsuneonella troitsensis]